MSMLTRDAILSADDLPREKVEVPEWGGYVYVQTLSARAKEEWESEMVQAREKDESANVTNIRASLAALTVCDDTGLSLFTSDDIEVLNEKSASALERVFNKSRELNMIGNADIEELAKNSEETPDDDTPSD